MKNYLLFGPPGVGKGTQSSFLCEKFNLIHISTGDIIRAEQKKGTKIGKLADKLIDQGNFLPDEHVIELVKTVIIDNPKAEGFLFDGFPRTLFQAKVLDEFLFNRKTPIIALLNLTAGKKVLLERIVERGKTSGRKDDNKEVFETRFTNYVTETRPVINYFEQRRKKIDINGDQEIEKVTTELLNAIEF